MFHRLRVLALCAAVFAVALAPAVALAGAPAVVATSPANGAAGVDPATAVITVTFDAPMMDGGWSWVYESQDTFPEMTGQPSFSADKKTCSLPVRLAPGKAYVIWINAEKFNNFKAQDGTPATPYRLTFSTK